jgi:hypothetical protein
MGGRRVRCCLFQSSVFVRGQVVSSRVALICVISRKSFIDSTHDTSTFCGLLITSFQDWISHDNVSVVSLIVTRRISPGLTGRSSYGEPGSLASDGADMMSQGNDLQSARTGCWESLLD